MQQKFFKKKKDQKGKETGEGVRENNCEEEEEETGKATIVEDEGTRTNGKPNRKISVSRKRTQNQNQNDFEARIQYELNC